MPSGSCSWSIDRTSASRPSWSSTSSTIPETQRKFPAEYNVQHLTSNTIDPTSRVCISTIQRIFSILRGDEEMDEEIDEHSVYELPVSEPVTVEYNPKLPPDAFDVIIVDECHRSIYGAVAAGARVLRRAPDRADGHPDQADLRLLPPEPRDGVLPRAGGRRWRQRGLHRLQDQDRDHRERLEDRDGRVRRLSRPDEASGSLGGGGRTGRVHGQAARSGRGGRGPDPHRAQRRSRTSCSPSCSPGAPRCRRR